MPKVVLLLAKTTWRCPQCGAPIFPLLDNQETPKEATALGIERQQIRLCYICVAVHVLEDHKV